MRTRSQRLLSMVLALSMLLTFLPLSAFAEGTPPPYADSQELNGSNTYEDDSHNKYVYTLNSDGTTAALLKFTGEDADVPSSVEKNGTTYTVTAIGENAFALTDDSNRPIFNTNLESVFLPSSIQTIGHGAFSFCSKLSKIILREGLTTVEHGAFAGTGLTDVTLPKSLKKVGDSAFVSISYVGTHYGIQTVTYNGTEDEWNELASNQNFATTNPQLVPKKTEDAEGVDLRCAHTVTFDVGEHGTAPEEQVVQYDEKAEKPSDPEENGYTFKYWFTKSENGEEKEFHFENSPITEDTKLYAHWEEVKKPTTPEQPGTQEKPNPTPPEGTDKPGTQQPGTTTPTTPPESTGKPGTPEKPNEPTPPEVPAVEEDDTAAIGYAAAAVTAAFVGWGAYRIGSEVYLKYLLPKDVLLPQNRIQLAELLWEDAGRPAPADDAAYTDVDANDTDARQAARWAVENGLLTLPDTEKPEEFAPYRSVSYAKSARAWNKAQQLKENAAAR